MSVANAGDSIKLFLSTVTSEFEPCRLAVKGVLVGPLVDVKEQADFINLGLDTLAMLDEFIQHCSGVVHLIGDATGDLPDPVNVRDLLARHADFAARLPFLASPLAAGVRFSFTQWEAYLALYHGKLLLLMLAELVAASME